MKKALALAFAAAALSSAASAAQFKIAGYPIPLMIESPTSGIFVEVVQELIRRTGADFEIVVYPAQRTVGAFHAGEIDAFFPALDVLIEKDKSATEPMYVKSDFAFVRKAPWKPRPGSGSGIFPTGSCRTRRSTWSMRPRRVPG